jgi:branched-chain amino acid transport system substrate-binding protein
VKLGKWVIGLLAVGAFAGPLVATAEAKESVFLPMFTYRTGPFAPGGTKVANGYVAYLELLNKRDGGIEGVEVKWEECEFGYKTDRGVECYERLKPKGSVISNPYSTGLTYKLIPKAPVDQIPILSMGYGMSGAADGRYFPWVFNFPTSYWSQASAFIKYVGTELGGMNKLKGKKIGLIFLESGYGREPIPLFEALGKKFGYSFKHWAVPGKQMADQRSQWRKIVRWNPDYLFMWGWGVMNPTAVSRATEFGYPMSRFIGVWWSGDELDTKPSGVKAKGYRAGTFHAPGAFADVHKDLLKHVYGGNEAAAKKRNFGDVLYNRGVFNAMLATEAIRIAIKKFGKKVTGKEVRWGLENLKLDEKRMAELGAAGFGKPIRITCADHEGNGPVLFQEWDGTKWKIISDWVEPMRATVRPMLEAAAVKEAKKWKYKKRENCS